jgi:WD40 repeat protein
MLVSGSVDTSARIWHLSVGQPGAGLELRGHDAQIYAVAIDPAGGLIATAGADHCVMLWDAQNGAPLGRLPHNGKVYTLTFVRDGRLITGTTQSTVSVWDTRARRLRHEWQAHARSVYALACAPAGEVLASGSADNDVRLWSLDGYRHIATLRGHEGTVFSLAFSPDGARLASGSYDQSVRLWSARGEALSVVDRNASFNRAVAFSADGALLCSGGADELVRVWRMPDGELLRRFKSEPPYAGLNIGGVSGITDAQRRALIALGAVD